MKHFCQFRNFFFSTLSLKVWSFTTHFPQTLVWSYHSSTEVWSLSIKSVVFFIPHSVYTITTHFLCHYKLSHCLPTYLSYSPFECLSACRSDCLSHCLWSFPLCGFVCVSFCLFVCLLSSCLFAC